MIIPMHENSHNEIFYHYFWLNTRVGFFAICSYVDNGMIFKNFFLLKYAMCASKIQHSIHIITAFHYVQCYYFIHFSVSSLIIRTLQKYTLIEQSFTLMGTLTYSNKTTNSIIGWIFEQLLKSIIGYFSKHTWLKPIYQSLLLLLTTKLL